MGGEKMAKPIDENSDDHQTPAVFWRVKPPSEEEFRQMAALAAWHDEWVARKLAEAPFNPEGRPEGSDYNLHYVDLEADDEEFHVRVREILSGNIDPVPPSVDP
jgi:hypothetical protein